MIRGESLLSPRSFSSRSRACGKLRGRVPFSEAKVHGETANWGGGNKREQALSDMVITHTYGYYSQ